MNAGGNWDIGTPVSGSANLTLDFPSGFVVNVLDQDIANPLEVQSLHIDNIYASMNFNTGNPIRFKNLGAAPTINLGTSSSSTTFNIPLEFADPTTITQLGYNGVNFNGALSGSDVTFATGTSNVYYRLGGSSANSLAGSTLVKDASVVQLTKPSNTVAIGGNITVDGVNAYLYVNSSGGNNQLAAGTDVTLVNGAHFQNDSTAQAIDDLVVNSNGSVEVFNSGVLIIGGQISSSAGVGRMGYGSGTVVFDFSGLQKTIDVTSTGAGEYLQIRDGITNGSINKTGPGKLIVSSNVNNFNATNIVTAGTLVGGPQTIGTVTNNATVELNATGTLAANQITGPGQVVLTSSITYGGAQNYSGGTVLQGGFGYGDASTLLGTFAATTSGGLAFNQNTNATWTGGSLSGPAVLQVQGSGVLGLTGNNNYSGTTAVFPGSTLEIQSDTAIGTGQLQAAYGTLRATGSRTLPNSLYMQGVTFDGSGDFNFTDTGAKQPFGPTTHNSTGTTDIAGKWITGSQTITVNAGQLAVGDPNVVNGFTSSGPINVNGGTLTVRSLNFISLPTVTLAGGTLNAPNGYAIPLGAVLQGNGGVTGRVASANGSTIIATGAMTVGDVGHVAGVNLDGELYTGPYAVTLADANQAVVGSVTHLGDGTNNGTFNAPNGLIVNFGRNITGRGQINSTNALAQAVIMNGDVQGDSFANYLEFTGYVKGVGTFTNVAFSGTYSPGLSPAVVEVHDTLLTATNVLEMEIGGVSRGSQYDGIDIDGLLSLDGTLKLTLLGGFQPSLSDSWQLFDGTTTGSFRQLDLPSLAPGLSWDFRSLYQTGSLSIRERALGDFDLDGVLGIPDIDQLVVEISGQTSNLDFDLTGDGLVDGSDLTEWLSLAGQENLPSGNAYQVGDANLDGVVDGSDFGLWNANKFTSAAAWSRGDFNADAVVDGSDFNLWNAQKFSAAGQASVPEPAAAAVAALWAMVLWGRRQR